MEKIVTLDDGSKAAVYLDPLRHQWVGCLVGPDTLNLPLQPPRLNLTAYAAYHEGATEAGRRVMRDYKAELERRRGALAHFMAAARASRLGWCHL